MWNDEFIKVDEHQVSKVIHVPVQTIVKSSEQSLSSKIEKKMLIHSKTKLSMSPVSPVFHTVESVKLVFELKHSKYPVKSLKAHISAQSVSILLFHFSPTQGKTRH